MKRKKPPLRTSDLKFSIGFLSTILHGSEISWALLKALELEKNTQGYY